MYSLMEGSEPFFKPGGPVGCLLIHGFTGTPYEMRGLGDFLADKGYCVYGPRLAHHGTSAADMTRSRWWDWYFAALDGWHLLRANCEQVFVIGLSMGGLTALLLAAKNPVAGVVTMSAPAVYMKNEWQFIAARYLWWLRPLWKKSPGERSLTPSYREIPVRAAGELLIYRKELDAALPSVTAPALLMHAVHDKDVPFENLNYIYDKIGSSCKKKIRIEQGGHVLTEDADKEKVYQEVIDFLAEMAA
jgi:carboxylesterase